MKRHVLSILFAVLPLSAWLLGTTAALSQHPSDAPVLAEDVQELLDTLDGLVGIYGDDQIAMDAEENLKRLGKQDSDNVLPHLIAALKSPPEYHRRAWDYRMAVIEVLRHIGPPAAEAVPILIDIWNDPDEQDAAIKWQASYALADIGAPTEAYKHPIRTWFRTASPAEIERSVQHKAYFIRRELRRGIRREPLSGRPSESMIETSVRSLAVYGEQAAAALPALLRAYNDQRIESEQRGSVANTMTAIGVADIAAATAEAKAPDDPFAEIVADTRRQDDLISGLAMDELGRLGVTEPVIEALVDALRDNHNPAAAAGILSGFGAKAKPAIPYLLTYIHDDRAGANAIYALGEIGAGDHRVIAELVSILTNPNHPQRGDAAAALAELNVVSAVEHIIPMLFGGQKDPRILAANALGQLGQHAAVAVPPLSRMLKDPDMDMRRAAVVALGRIGPAADPAVPGIKDQLQSTDQRLRNSATAALEQIGSEAADAARRIDAERYGHVDHAEYQRLQTAGHDERAWHFVLDLPEIRRIALARYLLSDEDANFAYLGAGLLIRAGHAEETVATLAVMIVSGKAETEVRLFGFDWAHSDDPNLMGMFDRIEKYLRSNVAAYTAAEHERVREFLGPVKSERPAE